ncbi:MAG: ectoine hydroxylase, partial [Acidimicrobiia bacterium]|nr:ectoine hydroxylase [Acidimicrobiia bacterium]
MTTRTLSPTDRYPSRVGTEQKFIKRGDPVLWGPKKDPLDQVELDQFHHHGFVVREGLLDPDTVAEGLAEVERLRADPEVLQSDHVIPDPETGDFRTLFAVHDTSPMFEWLAADARLAGVARQLLDDDVYIHQSILEVNGPLSSHPNPWHSDFETWHVEDGIPAMRTISASIALTDNHAWTGPMTMITGSHGWYLSYEDDGSQSPNE